MAEGFHLPVFARSLRSPGPGENTLPQLGVYSGDVLQRLPVSRLPQSMFALASPPQHIVHAPLTSPRHLPHAFCYLRPPIPISLANSNLAPGSPPPVCTYKHMCPHQHSAINPAHLHTQHLVAPARPLGYNSPLLGRSCTKASSRRPQRGAAFTTEPECDAAAAAIAPAGSAHLPSHSLQHAASTALAWIYSCMRLRLRGETSL